MKKYSFPLSRVMDWRNTQVQLEQSKLERLHAELRNLEARAAALRAEVKASQHALVLSSGATGAELTALDAYRRSAALQCGHLDTAAVGCRNRLAAQMTVITERRREARLLERLHERKFTAWAADYTREIDREADELFLASRGRRIQEAGSINSSEGNNRR